MIHKYKLNGYNIALDVNSGAVHILDDISYDILEILNDSIKNEIDNNILKTLESKYSKDDIIESYNELYNIY